MAFKSFDEIIDKLENSNYPMVVADPSGEEVIEALCEARSRGIIEPILVGMKEKILPLIKGTNIEDAELVEVSSQDEACSRSVELVRNGKGKILMKGKVSTPSILKAVLDPEKGIRKGKLLSHIAVMEIQSYHKLTIHTDAGMNIYPDVSKKAEIIKNGVWFSKKLGITKPIIAVLAAIETINPDMPETLDAAMLVKMGERGEFGEVTIDGPVAFDLAISKEAAKRKGIETAIAGETDIFIYPNISSGNITVKSLIYLANARVGGIVVGAKVPIVLLSRADTPKEKLASIALGALVA
ncbi:MAG: bifunctional enoyl-CoA hydratase/phosphate acetyltransferase [bacterium]